MRFADVERLTQLHVERLSLARCAGPAAAGPALADELRRIDALPMSAAARRAFQECSPGRAWRPSCRSSCRSTRRRTGSGATVRSPASARDRRLDGVVDVLVIGAGLTGASTAYHLAGRGLRVAVVDAGDPASEASGRNGGHFELVPENSIGEYRGLAAERLKFVRRTLPRRVAHGAQRSRRAAGRLRSCGSRSGTGGACASSSRRRRWSATSAPAGLALPRARRTPRARARRGGGAHRGARRARRAVVAGARAGRARVHDALSIPLPARRRQLPPVPLRLRAARPRAAPRRRALHAAPRAGARRRRRRPPRRDDPGGPRRRSPSGRGDERVHARAAPRAPDRPVPEPGDADRARHRPDARPHRHLGGRARLLPPAALGRARRPRARSSSAAATTGRSRTPALVAAPAPCTGCCSSCATASTPSCAAGRLRRSGSGRWASRPTSSPRSGRFAQASSWRRASAATAAATRPRRAKRPRPSRSRGRRRRGSTRRSSRRRGSSVRGGPQPSRR